MRSTLLEAIVLQPYSYETFRQHVWKCSKDFVSLAQVVVGCVNAIVRFTSPTLNPVVPEQAQFGEALLQLQAHGTKFVEIIQVTFSRWGDDYDSIYRERWAPYDETAWSRFEESVVEAVMPSLRIVRVDLNALKKQADSHVLDLLESVKYLVFLDKAHEKLATLEAHLTASPW